MILKGLILSVNKFTLASNQFLFKIDLKSFRFDSFVTNLKDFFVYKLNVD
jgi:hypothetical protein